MMLHTSTSPPKSETGEMKASLFIYDISDNSSAEKTFEDHKVGGTVRRRSTRATARKHERVAKSNSICSKFIR